MGVEIDFTEIPILQKQMISQCVACGKPAITATQMLDSMIEHPRPTRAEITDVANAIRQAAAVISEESGTNGHAATVGLTLGKAVIVGAAGAVQRLKDGTMVSVDCARGVVQTLPQ